MKHGWQFTVVLALLSVILGYLLAQGALPKAYGQAMGGAAGKTTVVIGEVDRLGRLPVVVLDSLEECIVVYEYSTQANTLELQAARNFRFDKQIRELRNQGLTVEEVRQQVGQ